MRDWNAPGNIKQDIARLNRIRRENAALHTFGNLEFLRVDYKAAILGYEQSLKLIPGAPESSALDGIGRDAAWNRAVALHRLEEEQEDAGQTELFED